MASERLAGKRALVTGGARGLGYAIASALAAEGARVAITSRQGDAAGAAAAKLGNGAIGIGCDVRDAESVRRLFAVIAREFGTLDVLVNNAGIAHEALNVDALPLESWRRVLETNLTGTFLCSQAALPLMRDGATIVNLLSVAAKGVFPGMAAYVASKWGALGLTETLREELRPRGIRVIGFMPGATDTDIWNQFWADAPREKMMSPESVAAVLVNALALPANATVEQLVIAPTGGTL